jgi:hypothetical protein
MITMLWRKHWLELRGLWLFAAVMAALPALLLRVNHAAYAPKLADVFIATFAIIVLVLPPRFASTGLETSAGVRPRHGADPARLFTLSLPLQRRFLFFYRAIFALSLMETGAALGLLIGGEVFVHMGGTWQAVSSGLWVLLAMVPVYFLDCALSIRFTEVSIMWVHIGCILGMLPVLSLFGFRPEALIVAIHTLSPLSFAISAVLVAIGLAGVTVWRLNHRDY